MWDNMFGEFTYDNAHQRLYVYMNSLSNSACSIFDIAEDKGIKHFQYVDFSYSRKKAKTLYRKYKGKTEFMKVIFPEYFGGVEDEKLATLKATLHYNKLVHSL